MEYPDPFLPTYYIIAAKRRAFGLDCRLDRAIVPRLISLLQRQQLDILVPAVLAVVLQANVALARVVLVGDVELVVASVGTFVRSSPLIEVHAGDGLAVEFHRD